MNEGICTGAGRGLLPLLYIINLFFLITPRCLWGEVPSARNFCNVPPIAGYGVKPNLLLLFDNSASMYDPAYTNSSANPPTYCLDDSYRDTTSYPGYFDQGTFYSYQFNKITIKGTEVDTGNFVPAGTTSPCGSSSTPYLCVAFKPDFKAYDIYKVPYDRADSFTASGNFLNWLTMSKLDIEKKVLTGGKVVGVEVDGKAVPMLQGESHGCQGKRFVKMNGDVTFAVRGPIPIESDYLGEAGKGGITRVEIFAKAFNKAACLDSIAKWQTGAAVADLQAAIGSCLDAVSHGMDVNNIPTRGKVYNDIMSVCYSYLGKEGSIKYPDIKTQQGGSFVGVLPDCQARYKYYSNLSGNVPANTGEDICAKNVNGSGFLGGCYVVNSFGTPPYSCSLGQTRDYCRQIGNPVLTDPSNPSVPGFILDAGVSSLGEVSATMRVLFAPPATPQGVVQQFSEAINIGAMIFNESGTGGRVVSYLNDPAAAGDHGAGLSASLNRVAANAWTPLAATFYEALGYFANKTGFQLQSGDIDAKPWPASSFSCQKHNILLVTDGMSTMDRAPAVNDFVAQDWTGLPSSQRTTNDNNNGPPNQGSYNLDDLAWIGRNRNLATGNPALASRDYLSTHVVYTGVPGGGSTPYNSADSADCSSLAGTPPGKLDESVPEQMMQLVACRGGGRIARAQNPADLEVAIRTMFQLIGSGSNSGTESSILTTGNTNGAIFLQEQFYPGKSFPDGSATTSASWVGEMQGLWYYIDPFIGSTGAASTIREDAYGSGGKRILDLTRDRAVDFSSDVVPTATLYPDTNGDGVADPGQPTAVVSPDAVQSLWRAGLTLWGREPGDRTIYTQVDGRNLTPFLDSSLPANQQLLQAADSNEAASMVSFVKGTDTPGARNRTVRADGVSAKVWKLGDIVSSTPALQSVTSLGSYHLPSPRGYGDPSYRAFINYSGGQGKGGYQRRGTVYVGANDGMLHAFRLGTLQVGPAPADPPWPVSQKAALAGTDLGREEWAFIPRNALPYLRYLKDPSYPHLYYVDGGITLADVSLGDPADAGCQRNNYWNCPRDETWGTNWRTVLIGGMGLGGATSLADCSGKNCVTAPPQVPGQESVGLSSYFALDVTDQSASGQGSPKLLWEFSHPDLGYSTSGAAIVRIKAARGAPDTTNGKWFAVFASGPTGPIDASCQFQGKSGQTLKIFVVDLGATPAAAGSFWSKGNNYWEIDTAIPAAFGGSLAGAGIDTDRWNPSAPGFYEDDALYLGYTKAAAGGWKGGVLRILTGGNLDPARWTVSTLLDDTGPVTGAVAKLQDRGKQKLWLYFGTGRYYFTQDDMTDGRALYGISEPCYTVGGSGNTIDATCSTALKLSDLNNVSDPNRASVTTDFKGWWIGLDPVAAGDSGSERLTGNPISSTGGSVFFTTFKPSYDYCQAGKSYLWGVKYDDGGLAGLNGKALVALSNGSSRGVSLSSLSGGSGDPRRSPALPGKASGTRIITKSGLKPLKKIIHIQER